MFFFGPWWLNDAFTKRITAPSPMLIIVSSSSSIMHLLYQGHRFWKKMWQQKKPRSVVPFSGTIMDHRSKCLLLEINEKKLRAYAPQQKLTDDNFINWSKGNTRTESLLWFCIVMNHHFFPQKTNECPASNQWLVQMYFLLKYIAPVFVEHSFSSNLRSAWKLPGFLQWIPTW